MLAGVKKFNPMNQTNSQYGELLALPRMNVCARHQLVGGLDDDPRAAQKSGSGQNLNFRGSSNR